MVNKNREIDTGRAEKAREFEVKYLRCETIRLQAELNEALMLMCPGGEATVFGASVGEPYNSMASSLMADRMRFLAKHGWLTLVYDRGRHVVAEVGPKALEERKARDGE